MTDENYDAAGSDRPFRILAVCTGNICRSPMLERVLQSQFDHIAVGEFEVTSAGTGALVGSPIDTQVAELIHLLGGKSTDFEARQLKKETIEGKDLILGLTREHRSSVVDLAPSLVSKTFTLREFVRALTTLQGDTTLSGPRRWREIVPKAVRSRKANPLSPEADDVVDPHKRPNHIYQQMTRELVPAAKAIANWENRHR
jgi:protein-tyrosine phosphatase